MIRAIHRALSRSTNFSALSVRDLLAAREAYHLHLLSLDHVVATAVGLYRIRDGDPDSERPDRTSSQQPGANDVRTMANSSIKPWSYPCLLVFTDTWLDQGGVNDKPEALVPRLLYLPDGRIVPTCTIMVERMPRPPAVGGQRFPAGAFGGGYPVTSVQQGWERRGTISCLVTDGGTVYAMTSRHLLGAPGSDVFVDVGGGERRKIGVASKRRLNRLPLPRVYPGFPGASEYVNLDVGLVEIDDMSRWTAQVYGVGEIGEVIDLHPTSLDLRLIGVPVRAFGAATGEMKGEIQGFFFRYRTMGGVDYVADLMIGQRQGDTPLVSHPGDSGALWFIDPPDDGGLDPASERLARAWRRQPIAVEWGGQVFASGPEATTWPIVLGASLSTVCRELDVEVIQNWDVGLSEFWGKVGHFKVGAAACTLVSTPALAKLMAANAANIGVSDEDLAAGELPGQGDAFIPLADVADLVWRQTRKRDEANHFADMDEEGFGPFASRTLLELWHDKHNRTPAKWTAFYDAKEAATGKNIPDKHRGALPFRVGEMFEAMVTAVKDKKVDEFVCIAGLLAHYVGDACQALHVSYLHHGRPGHTDEADVHSIYETKLLDRYADKIVAGVNAELEGKHAKPTIDSGARAADHVVKLMKRTIQELPPMDVLDAFNAAAGHQRLPHMWDELGTRTIERLADGALTLAELWEGAWKEGDGGGIAQGDLVDIGHARLKELYMDKDFIPVRWLKDM